MPSLTPRPPGSGVGPVSPPVKRVRPRTARVFPVAPADVSDVQRNTTLHAPPPPAWLQRPASGGTIRLRDVVRRQRAAAPEPPAPVPVPAAARRQLPECRLCRFVSDEVDAFSFRQRHNVAMSSCGTEKVQLLRHHRRPAPAVVRMLFEEDQLRRSALVARLQMLPPGRLRAVFRRSMRYRGTLAQVRFCSMIASVLQGQPYERKEAEALFHLFDVSGEGEVEYVTFFVGLTRLMLRSLPRPGGAELDPLDVLNQGWKVMLREKGVLGSVTRYELQLLLGRAQEAGAPVLQIQRMREGLFGARGLRFNLGDGGCAFSDLKECVTRDAVLRHGFLTPHGGQLAEILSAEVAREQQRRRDGDGQRRSQMRGVTPSSGSSD
eukprot:TRINITY_DN26044_c0_g1_i1.p1 TRINITY_DN26044_c0_g1~~TRINITY_DN26044_c0_g1_i1.p1  ORF type:complete len:392 (+),score=135.16 TRINITY_DN26044_c0_g1_i1:44-1177(+)